MATEYVTSFSFSSIILVLISNTESVESHADLILTILHPLLPYADIEIPNLTVVTSCRQFPLCESTSVCISSITMDLTGKKPGVILIQEESESVSLFLRELLLVFT